MLPFDAEAQSRLAALLDPKSETANTMRLDEAQAFMLALASGPEETPAEIWLPEILGGSGVFAPGEEAEIRALAERMVFDLKTRLDAGGMPDLLLYDNGCGGSDFYTWCNAYLYALDVAQTDWFETAADDDFEDLFYSIMALGGMFDAHKNEQAVLTFSDADLTQLEQELPYALQEIYAYWQRRAVN